MDANKLLDDMAKVLEMVFLCISSLKMGCCFFFNQGIEGTDQAVDAIHVHGNNIASIFFQITGENPFS